MQYCSLQHGTFLSPPDTSTTGHCFFFGSASSFLLELFLHSSPVAYWVPTDLGSSSFSALFAFSYCSWGSQGRITEVVCHSLLWWTTFCQNSPPWPVRLGWPYKAWLIVPLSYTRIWSMCSFWLVSCDYCFHSVCPLMEEYKQLVQASWWEGLAVGKTGSCSGGQGLAQYIFNPIFCWWVRLCSLPRIWPEVAQI